MVGSWGGVSRFFLWVPGAPSPSQGPRSRRGRGAGVRFLHSLPSAALAAPEIKIKCGLGRGSGVWAWQRQRGGRCSRQRRQQQQQQRRRRGRGWRRRRPRGLRLPQPGPDWSVLGGPTPSRIARRLPHGTPAARAALRGRGARMRAAPCSQVYLQVRRPAPLIPDPAPPYPSAGLAGSAWPGQGL